MTANACTDRPARTASAAATNAVRTDSVRTGGARRRLFTRLLLLPLTALLGILSIFSATAANADQFSPFSGTGVLTYRQQFGDSCWVAIGPVYDQTGSPTAFAVIGGVTVQGCSARHTFYAAVSEAYGFSRSGPWFTISGSQNNSGYITNAYGFGTCGSSCPSGRITETPRLCGGSAAYYYTTATITEYNAAGAWVRSLTYSSAVPTSPVQAKARNSNGSC